MQCPKTAPKGDHYPRAANLQLLHKFRAPGFGCNLWTDSRSELYFSQIIEEGPITIAPPETVRRLEEGACRLAKCVNYIGAATVEYLYSMDTGEFYFLELNPRLQVFIWVAVEGLWRKPRYKALVLCSIVVRIFTWSYAELRGCAGRAPCHRMDC